MPQVFNVSNPEEFKELFEADPIEARPSDGFWFYRFSDSHGVTLGLSFDLFEGSVQTTLCVQNFQVALVSHESAISLVAEKLGTAKRITGKFKGNGAMTTLTVDISPRIVVKWSHLVV